MSFKAIPALTSNIEVCGLCIKSEETKSSSVQSIIPFRFVSQAFFTAATISSYEAPFFSLQVKSTTETSKVGTLNDIPVSFPSSSGITLPTALAAPVEDGIMLPAAALPPLQSLCDGPSTVFCVAVVE